MLKAGDREIEGEAQPRLQHLETEKQETEF